MIELMLIALLLIIAELIYFKVADNFDIIDGNNNLNIR